MRYAVRKLSGFYLVSYIDPGSSTWSTDILKAKLYGSFSDAKAQADGLRGAAATGVTYKGVKVHSAREKGARYVVKDLDIDPGYFVSRHRNGETKWTMWIEVAFKFDCFHLALATAKNYGGEVHLLVLYDICEGPHIKLGEASFKEVETVSRETKEQVQ